MSDQKDSNSAVIEPPKATPAKPKTEPQSKPRRQPPYAVVVLNDDDHTFEYVIDALCRFCGHSVERAFQLASQIHRNGRARCGRVRSRWPSSSVISFEASVRTFMPAGP